VKYQIKRLSNGAVLFEAELPDTLAPTGSVTLGEAVKQAVKARADLQGAYLQGAYLRGADLQGADLRGAYLQGALGVSPQITTPLLLLKDQPGRIRLYKLVTGGGQSPIRHTKLTYEIGKRYEVANADTNPQLDCGPGLSVATLDWCLKEWKLGYRIFLVEFEAADIACIPTATDGKIRLYRFEVVGEVPIDPVALGLVKPEESPA
jgi:hypothetical protein